MNKTVKRLIIAAVVLGIVQGGSMLIVGGTKMPDVALPPTNFETMPMQLGDWKGEQQDLDPKVFAAVGADMLVNRFYKGPRGVGASLHCAVFSDYTMGINHNPGLCYRLSGWLSTNSENWTLRMSDGKDFTLAFTTWQMKQQRVRVVYWFQLGDHVMFDKWGMGATRFAMAWEHLGARSQEPWPALIKVLIQIPASEDVAADKERLGDFVKQVYDWTNANYGYRSAIAGGATPETDSATASPESVSK